MLGELGKVRRHPSPAPTFSDPAPRVHMACMTFLHVVRFSLDATQAVFVYIDSFYHWDPAARRRRTPTGHVHTSNYC